MLEWTSRNAALTIFDRFSLMQPQCEFGKVGVCCRLCSMGPCRINGSRLGVCGATADTIIARNLLQLVTIGASLYLHQSELAAETLRSTAAGKSVFSITDPEKLGRLAYRMGIQNGTDVRERAQSVADALLLDLHGDRHTTPSFLQGFALPSRLNCWKAQGLLPGGPLVELRDALAKSATSVDGDYLDLAMTALRLSIAVGFSGLLATNLVNDILLGTPSITEASVDLGILDPTTVNLVAHGHDPYVATAVLRVLSDEKVQAQARAAGATGIKLYGSACVGQELLQRAGSSAGGIAGLVGNCAGQELMIATGLVDLVLLDLNCVHPSLKAMADRFHTVLVPVSPLVHLEGGRERCEFAPDRVAAQALDLVDAAINAFQWRRQSGHQPSHRRIAVSGYCSESITALLGGTLDPLKSALAEGDIRGIVAVVGCTTVRGGHGSTIVRVVRELIQRDLLVINSGCCSGAMQMEGMMHPDAARFASPGLRRVCESLGIPPCLNFGACTDVGRIAQFVMSLAQDLGVDSSQLPVAVSVPEYFDQKALCDGFFAVALGLLTHVSPMPPAGHNHAITRLLTEDVEALTGGRLLLEPDPLRAAQVIEAHIDSRRKALGLCNVHDKKRMRRGEST